MRDFPVRLVTWILALASAGSSLAADSDEIAKRYWNLVQQYRVIAKTYKEGPAKERMLDRIFGQVQRARLDLRAAQIRELELRKIKEQGTGVTASIQSLLPSSSQSAGLPEWPGMQSATPETFGKNSAIGYGYCTDYVKHIYTKATGQSLKLSGDARNWYSSAVANGYSVLNASEIASVKPGSIAVWDDGGYGHVGFVANNDGKGTISIAESNWGRVDVSGKSAATVKFLKEEAITSQFNVATKRSMSYSTASLRGGTYKLLGFIVPK